MSGRPFRSASSNRRRNAYPTQEITEQGPILIETNRECVRQTIFITVVLVEEVAHRLS